MRTTDFSRAALALILVSLAASAAVPGAFAQTAPGSGLTAAESSALRLNTLLFDATVPSTPYLGENFSVSVQLTNVSNESIPVIVQVSTPPATLYVTPHVHTDLIPPGAQVTEIFWIVAIQTTHTAQNVTANVWVWFQSSMPSPVLVTKYTAYVHTITPSPLAPYVGGALVLVAVAAGAAVLFRKRLSVYLGRLSQRLRSRP